MARGLRGLWLLLAQLLAAAACRDSEYGAMLQQHCLEPFRTDMEALGQPLWCDWDLTFRTYSTLSTCTQHVARSLHCFWPSPAVTRFFLNVHRSYFRTCPSSGLTLQDPPSSVLCPFIVVPTLVTLLVTLLVVWRSPRPEGVV